MKQKKPLLAGFLALLLAVAMTIAFLALHSVVKLFLGRVEPAYEAGLELCQALTIAAHALSLFVAYVSVLSMRQKITDRRLLWIIAGASIAAFVMVFVMMSTLLIPGIATIESISRGA